MAEPETQRVKVIRDSGESLAVVEDREQIPWSLDLPWEVIAFLPPEPPLVFESVEQARAWVKHDKRAAGFNWDFLNEPIDGEPASQTDSASIERDKKATEDYLAFAKKQGLEPNSAELFELAHKEGIIDSLALYETFGCGGECHIVQSYLSNWGLLGLYWTPRSCKVYGVGVVYAGADKGGSRKSLVSGPDCIDLPFQPQAVEPL